MNPHRLTYGFTRDAGLAQILAIATLTGFALTRDKKPFIWNRETILTLTLWLWFTLTTIFALYPEPGWVAWQTVSKILLASMLTVPLFQDRDRLRALLLVIALPIGFCGFKGGVFVILSGGAARVLGPEGTFKGRTTTSRWP